MNTEETRELLEKIAAAEKKQNAVYAPATRKYFFSYGK